MPSESKKRALVTTDDELLQTPVFTCPTFRVAVNLDTNGRVAEIDLVASSVRSANDGVGHWVWLSEISGVGLAKRLSGGQSRDVSGHFPSINQI